MSKTDYSRDGGDGVTGQPGLKDPTTMRSTLMVGIAAAALGIATVQIANAASAPARTGGGAGPATRSAPAPAARAAAPAPKAPTMTNQQLQPTYKPAPQMSPNLQKPAAPSLANKVGNGAPLTLNDAKGSNTPPPALPPKGVELGRVGSPPPAGPTPQQNIDANSRSNNPAPSGAGVTGTIRLPGG